MKPQKARKIVIFLENSLFSTNRRLFSDEKSLFSDNSSLLFFEKNLLSEPKRLLFPTRKSIWIFIQVREVLQVQLVFVIIYTFWYSLFVTLLRPLFFWCTMWTKDSVNHRASDQKHTVSGALRNFIPNLTIERMQIECSSYRLVRV